MWDSRAVAVDLDRVNAVLGEATALQEGTVVADLHALAGEVTGLEQLDAVVLAVLAGQKRQTSQTCCQILSLQSVPPCLCPFVIPLGKLILENLTRSPCVSGAKRVTFKGSILGK